MRDGLRSGFRVCRRNASVSSAAVRDGFGGPAAAIAGPELTPELAVPLARAAATGAASEAKGKDDDDVDDGEKAGGGVIHHLLASPAAAIAVRVSGPPLPPPPPPLTSSSIAVDPGLLARGLNDSDDADDDDVDDDDVDDDDVDDDDVEDDEEEENVGLVMPPEGPLLRRYSTRECGLDTLMLLLLLVLFRPFDSSEMARPSDTPPTVLLAPSPPRVGADADVDAAVAT